MNKSTVVYEWRRKTDNGFLADLEDDEGNNMTFSYSTEAEAKQFKDNATDSLAEPEDWVLVKVTTEVV
jgi:hypothetical protein